MWAVIPKLGYYTNDLAEETRDAVMEIYTQNIIKDGANHWSWDRPMHPIADREMKTTFIYDHDRSVYVTCYSVNLRIYGSEEVESSYSSGSVETNEFLDYFAIVQKDDETIFPWTVPRLFMSIHSPFVPISPLIKGVCLEKNKEYTINIRLVSALFNAAVYFKYM
ncbi:hypothetical protein NPIL_649451 [Nephila pilipes]|uniref:Uncharacterized protein n=1 Tax=Nephila pilipes TaxID=299642 RepID=A0A8X6Q4Z9_NEPPI|nr:hypothetical protein NPIL_649451 [Nephila pilipes]